MIVRVVSHPAGRRVFLFDRRLHHGLAGIVAMIAGAVAAWTDRRDAPWLKDTP